MVTWFEETVLVLTLDVVSNQLQSYRVKKQNTESGRGADLTNCGVHTLPSPIKNRGGGEREQK